MVEHLVLFKLKPEATDAQIDTMLDALRRLKSQLPYIVELSCGKNFCDRSQGHQVALRVLFNCRADLENYGPSDAHQNCVATYIKPIMDGVTVVDYEC